jgi:hypothetical protein
MMIGFATSLPCGWGKKNKGSREGSKFTSSDEMALMGMHLPPYGKKVMSCYLGSNVPARV